MEQKQEVKNTNEFSKLPIIDRRDPGKKYSEKEEKWLREISTYEFSNQEEPGLSIKFPYGSTRNKKNFMFFHGGKYQIPRFLARFVETCTTPIWKWKPDGSGSLIKERVGERPRFQMRELYE